MAKKDPLMNDDYELDVAPPSVAAKKMLGDITYGAEPLSDYMSIPCDRLIEYQGKKDSDFSPLPDDVFEDLVASVKKYGVLEAITVRAASGKPGTFEILAGEHRWKASKKAGLPSVPARVLRDCDDSLAHSVFSLTNTLRRENSIRDKINGWWHYLELTRWKREHDIDKLIQDGILSKEFSKESVSAHRREIYRYAKCHSLPPEFIDMLDDHRLGIKAGAALAALEPEKLKFLIPYKDSIKNQHAEQLVSLAKGEYPGLSWSRESVESILLPHRPVATASVRDAMKQARQVFIKRLAPEYYGEAKQVMEEAMSLYFEKHPEKRKKEES